MTLDASGRLLVNTTSSTNNSYYLQVTQGISSSTSILAQGSLTGYSGAGIFMSYESYGGRIESYDYATSAWKNIAIAPNGGSIGIGTSSPSYKLDVNGEINAVTRYRVNAATQSNQIIGDGTAFSIGGANNLGIRNDAGSIVFASGGATVQLQLNTSGNLGLGVTPSAWYSTGYSAFQVRGAALYSANGNDVNITSNAYLSTSPAWTYTTSSTATRYEQGAGGHRWFTAPSGTAGNAISFTQAMTLDASGRLAVGLTNPVAKFHVENPSSADPTSLSSTPTTNIFGMSTSPGGMLAAGIGATGGTHVWLQGRNVGGAGVSYPISLQPLGGNVGIGTTNPSQLLHLETTLASSSGVGTAIQITSGGAGGDQAWIGVNKGTGNGLEISVENRDIIFNTGATTPFGGSERMRITSGGELLINTTSDAGDYKLQVNGQIYSNISGQGDNNSKIEGNGSFLQIVGRADYASVNIAGAGTNNWEWGIRGETTLRLRENGNNRISIFSGGATEFSSSIKTAAPSGGTAKPWKLGEAGVSVGGANTTAVRVEIDGTTYYLLTAYLP
jgi:hypothetical protein